jgi:hypothetical protein
MRTVLLAASVAAFGFASPVHATSFVVPDFTIAQIAGSPGKHGDDNLVSDVMSSEELLKLSCVGAKPDDDRCGTGAEGNTTGELDELVQELFSVDLRFVTEDLLQLELGLNLCILPDGCRCESDCALEPVPEPGTLALFVTGLGTAFAGVRRKMKKS